MSMVGPTKPGAMTGLTPTPYCIQEVNDQESWDLILHHEKRKEKRCQCSINIHCMMMNTTILLVWNLYKYYYLMDYSRLSHWLSNTACYIGSSYYMYCILYNNRSPGTILLQHIKYNNRSPGTILLQHIKLLWVTAWLITYTQQTFPNICHNINFVMF